MNRNEFVRLYVKHESMLKAYIFGMVRDVNETEEILSDTAVLIFEKQDDFDATRDFGPWARGIAKNKAYEHWRRQGKRERLLSEEAMRAVENEYTERGEGWWRTYQEALRRCMEKMGQGSLAVVKAFYWKNRPIPEISADRGQSAEALRMRLSRIRKALKKCIQASTG